MTLNKFDLQQYNIIITDMIARQLAEDNQKALEELWKHAEWNEIKKSHLMSNWTLVHVNVVTTQSQQEILEWCLDNMPKYSYIQNMSIFQRTEWLIRNGDYLTAFTLRWS